MKSYNIMFNVGSVKYLVNFHDGVKTYPDGSAFYDIRSFKNRVEMNKFIKGLKSDGYVEKY